MEIFSLLPLISVMRFADLQISLSLKSAENFSVSLGIQKYKMLEEGQ